MNQYKPKGLNFWQRWLVGWGNILFGIFVVLTLGLVKVPYLPLPVISFFLRRNNKGDKGVL